MREFEEPRRGALLLDCRTTIRLTDLKQSLTYSGLLEGYPNNSLNQSIIDGVQSRLKKKSGWEPYLVPPVEREVPKRSIAKERPWMELPRIQCTAWFESKTLGEFGSRLAVIWFQDAFAFPIDPEVASRIRAIVWDDHAEPIDLI